MTYKEYARYVLDLQILHATEGGNERRGQLYINALSATRRDLAQKVRGTSFDPYYDDRRIPAFLAWLVQEWDK
jgi:hypothetical protein